MFQNVKGMTYSSGCEDNKYFLAAMRSYSVEVYGMSETNTGWQHAHLQADFKSCVSRQFQYGKTIFGYPSQDIDPLPIKETFQAGGTLQVIQGDLTTTVSGLPIQDTSGLGRWCGTSFIGKAGQKFSVITGYRTCSGSIQTAPLGSTFHREYEYFREKGVKAPQPRTQYLQDLSKVIQNLAQQGNAILLMMDANSTMEKDHKLRDFIEKNELRDLHLNDPAPSTFIGATGRRIDFMLGCRRTHAAMSRQGTLSYFEGPQSDHRGLYVDLKLDHIFGTQCSENSMVSTPRRHLKNGNPELVENYISSMHRYYETHKMQERIDNLHKTHYLLTRQQVRKLLTSWDNDQGRAMMACSRHQQCSWRLL
jgi:hypothetical protein